MTFQNERVDCLDASPGEKMSTGGKGAFFGLFVEPGRDQLARLMAWILEPNPYFRGLFQGRVDHRYQLVAFPVETQDPSVTGNDLPNLQARLLQMLSQTLLVLGLNNDG